MKLREYMIRILHKCYPNAKLHNYNFYFRPIVLKLDVKTIRTINGLDNEIKNWIIEDMIQMVAHGNNKVVSAIREIFTAESEKIVSLLLDELVKIYVEICETYNHELKDKYYAELLNIKNALMGLNYKTSIHKFVRRLPYSGHFDHLMPDYMIRESMNIILDVIKALNNEQTLSEEDVKILVRNGYILS
jgi:hypothetical protein